MSDLPGLLNSRVSICCWFGVFFSTGRTSKLNGIWENGHPLTILSGAYSWVIIQNQIVCVCLGSCSGLAAMIEFSLEFNTQKSKTDKTQD